ncbi:MAG: carbohydrate binding domain-containing protein [Bacteroidia bacterium]
MIRTALLLLFFPGMIISSFAQSFSGGYSFSLPGYDSTTQTYLPVFPRHTITDFVSTDENGNFTSNGVPIRFWGGNLSASGCFPPSNLAPQIAGRMRKMGVNLLRFHHMDNPWTDNNGTIFIRGTGNTRQLNTTTLDRLHALLASMKNEGVYANINLHVSRTFLPGDGVLYADSIQEFGKGVTIFDRQLVALQKEYASQLLGTVNPYTGLSLAADPVVAMVEITNENTLYGFWKENKLTPFANGGGILQRHADSLDQRWYDFLIQKYGNQAALAAAWDVSGLNQTGTQQLLNPGFESGTQNWILELHSGASATFTADNQSPASGNQSGKVTVNTVTGTNWHLQFMQAGMTFQQDSSYQVKFKARADRIRQINAGVMRHNDPYTWYGGASFQLTTQWQTYTFTVSAPENNVGQVRLTFDFNNQTGPVWFDDFSMGKPVIAGLEPGEDLAAGTVRRIPYAERLSFHPQRVADMAEFYLEIQKAYFNEMRSYLRDSLGVQVPISGVNAMTGPGDVYSASDLDYVDDHSYWDHPWFPNEPWSATDWQISNGSMLQNDRLGTIPSVLGGLQVADKPFTLSEYNHAYPNIYQVEMVPILAGYASLHGVDGIMFFTYHEDTGNWDSDRVPGYFALSRNHAVMGLFPIYSWAFRNGIISEDSQPHIVNYTREHIFQLPLQDNAGRWEHFVPYDNLISLTHGVKIGDTDATSTSGLSPASTPSSVYYANNTLRFAPNPGALTIETDKLLSITGNLPGMGGYQSGPLKMISGNHFGSVNWVSLTDDVLRGASRSLIAVSSRIQNTGMLWRGASTVNNNWGSAPTKIQSLNLDLELNIIADSIHLIPLDATGAAQPGKTRTILPQANGKFRFQLYQDTDQTMWYGMEAFGITIGVDPRLPETAVRLYPNPAVEKVRLEADTPIKRWELTDLSGRTSKSGHPAEPQTEINLSELAAGMYMVRVYMREGVVVKKLQMTN